MLSRLSRHLFVIQTWQTHIMALIPVWWLWYGVGCTKCIKVTVSMRIYGCNKVTLVIWGLSDEEYYKLSAKLLTTVWPWLSSPDVVAESVSSYTHKKNAVSVAMVRWLNNIIAPERLIYPATHGVHPDAPAFNFIIMWILFPPFQVLCSLSVFPPDEISWNLMRILGWM